MWCDAVCDLLAAYQTFLMRLTGQEDIVVGAPFGGRTDTATYPLVGYFINMCRSELICRVTRHSLHCYPKSVRR